MSIFASIQNWFSPQAAPRQRPQSRAHGAVSSDTLIFQNRKLKRNRSLLLPEGRGSTAYEEHLPQSADDKTVMKRTAIVLDNIDLYIENYYRKSTQGPVDLSETDMATLDKLDTGLLSSNLPSFVQKAKNIRPVAKHTLAHIVTSSISTMICPRWSLLPSDFVIIPRAVGGVEADAKRRRVLNQCLTRWRVLTAYLRPNPFEDQVYLQEREVKIKDIAQNFSDAFSPWKNPKYTDEQRTVSLLAILKESAELGIWLFSQGSELRFGWLPGGDRSSMEVVVSPSLEKLTDDQGNSLQEPQKLIKVAVQQA